MAKLSQLENAEEALPTALERPVRPRRRNPRRATKPKVSERSEAYVPQRDVPALKTSQILRKLLDDNQGKYITIQKIIDDLVWWEVNPQYKSGEHFGLWELRQPPLSH